MWRLCFLESSFFSSLAESFVNSKKIMIRLNTKRRLCPIISIFFPKVFKQISGCIKRFREDYGMYQKIPRRLRYVQKDSEKITVCPKRFREDYGMSKKIPRRLRYVLSSGTMFLRRRRRRRHLMMATFICFMIPTFIYRCVHPISWWDVHLSVRSSISRWRRSSHWTSFVSR
jgi:hypothetical protein